MTRKKILIVGYTNWKAATDIPYLFKRAGCDVDVFSCVRSRLLRGSIYTTWFVAPEDKAEYVQKLKTIVETGSYDWIVAGDDAVLRIFATLPDNEPLLPKLIPLSKLENQFILGSKAGHSLACTLYGILTPTYAVYDELQNPKILAEQVSFPLLLKIDQSAAGRGVFLCTTDDDVAMHLARLTHQQKEKLVFQHYITGDTVGVETLYKQGTLIAYAYSIATKTLEDQFGISSERRYVACPAIEEQLRFIGKSLGVHGFCSMTFIHDGSSHYLIEADLRPQTWFRFARFAGVDFSEGIRGFFSDTSPLLRPVFPSGATEIMVRHFPRDLSWNMTHKNYSGILKWFYNAEHRWDGIPWHDPVLLLEFFSRGVVSITKRIRHSICRVFVKDTIVS